MTEPTKEQGELYLAKHDLAELKIEFEEQKRAIAILTKTAAEKQAVIDRLLKQGNQ
jgi:NADH/NAD ratio-sensing transcriptional regulator Rex